MKMTKEQLARAKEALYQYELLRIKRIEAEAGIEFSPSEEYLRKREELSAQIRSNSLKATSLSSKKKLCILIVATLILALVITACAFGKQIKGFFVDMFESFATVQPVDSHMPDYKEHELTWLPEGYEKCDKETFKYCSKVVYSCDNHMLFLGCYSVSYLYAVIDTQRTEFEVFYLGDKEIYYKEKNDLYSFYWVNDEATLYLSCDTSVEWSDIERMIESVECVE